MKICQFDYCTCYNASVGSRQHNQFDFGIPSAAATVGGILIGVICVN